MAASAITLWQAGNGVTDKRIAPALYDKTFDQIRVISERVPRQGAQFFAERSTNQESYKEGSESAVLELPQVNSDTDAIPLLTPIKGFDKSVTLVQYRSGFIVSKTAVESQKTNLIMKMLAGLPNSALRKEEYAYASLFNSGFDESILAADGMAVFDSARPKEDPSAGTWTNLAASPGGITSGAFYTAWQHFQNFTDERGFPAPQKLTKLIFPPALFQTAMQVLNSEKVPENSLNADNPFRGLAAPIMYNWLTSSTAWFCLGDMPAMDNGFIMVWRVKPEYATISDSMNPELVYGKRLRMAFGVGCLHGKHIWGNAGA